MVEFLEALIYKNIRDGSQERRQKGILELLHLALTTLPEVTVKQERNCPIAASSTSQGSMKDTGKRTFLRQSSVQ